MPVQLWLLFIFLFRVMTLLLFWGCFFCLFCVIFILVLPILDIVMKFNRIMYQVKMICGAQASFFPLLLDFKLCPFLFFLFSPKVLVCPITW